MNRKKLPTILGVLILVIGVVAGVFLINSKTVFKIGANIASTPNNVRFSNITDTEATITWNTDIESKGFAKWGETQKALNQVTLDSTDKSSFVHSTTITGIKPDSTIYFKINSDGKDYDNEGIPWQFKTNPTKTTKLENLIATGIVLQADGSTPATAIVTLSINGVTLTAITSAEGTFIIPVSNYIETIDGTTAIEITVNGGQLGNASAVIYPTHIKTVPVIILGKSYDFRSLPQVDDSTLPQSSLTIPESVSVSSRFGITKSEIPNTVSTSSIDSIDEGEIILTNDPEFFGKAPAKSNIEVQVESELQSAVIATDSKGSWKWSPPNNLEPGEHKVTLKWRDAAGIIRTISKTFIVSAAEGPAFESTPSASTISVPTIKPTATTASIPTAIASVTPTIVKTPTATLQPTPETGNLTPTLGLFIMGIGILLSSIFVYKHSFETSS